MIFINTRPSSRAHSLTKAMQAKGLDVLELPLLELDELSISERESGYQEAFIVDSHYQALVVVSPSAARLGLALCPNGFIPNCAIIAVGEATANVLRQAGWQVRCPDESSNEGMMRMPELSKLGEGNHVLVWRGRGGRRLLVNHLQDKGVEVNAIAWYQRKCPESLKSNFQLIEPQLSKVSNDKESDANGSTSEKVVLISSGEAFTNWRRLIDELQSEGFAYNLSTFNYLTFGKRLTDTLEGLGLKTVRIDSLFTQEVWRGVVALNESDVGQ